MPGLDDRIRRGLEALAAGEEGSFEDVARRKGRARRRRRAQAATLAVAVLAGTTGGVVALTRTFGDLDRDRPTGRPEGSLIAFVSNRDGNDEIYVMRDDGTDLRNLTRHPADDRDPAWSPDGSMIAFASNRHGGRATGIYVMRADGTDVRRITTGTDHLPTWSPDGRSLLFRRWSRTQQGILEVKLKGGRATPFASVPSASPPTWSPDGRTLLFVDDLSLRLRALFPFPASCFATMRGESPGLYARDLASGSDRLVAGGSCISHVAWSSRNRLLFTQVVPDEIESSGATGAHTVLVFSEFPSGARDEAAFPCDLFDECRYPHVNGADWSPDGRRAVIGVEDGRDKAVYSIREDGSRWRRLTPEGWNASDPDWQPFASPSPVPGPTPTSAPTPTPIFHEICGDLPFPGCDWIVDVVRAASWIDRHNNGGSITAESPQAGDGPIIVRTTPFDLGLDAPEPPTDMERCFAPYEAIGRVIGTVICSDGETVVWAAVRYFVWLDGADAVPRPVGQLEELVRASLEIDARECLGPIRRERGGLEGDVDGDGVAQRVTVGKHLGDPAGCGATVEVVRGDEIAAIQLEPILTPDGRHRIELVALAQIDDRPGLEIIVARGRDEASLSLSVLSWRGDRPRVLRVEGAGDILHHGAWRSDPAKVPDIRFRGVDCAGEEHGTIVVGELIRSSDGSMLLRRSFYEAAYPAFREQPAATQWRELPDGVHRSALASEFPELRDEPFSSCGRA